MNFDDPLLEPVLTRFRGRADLAQRVLEAFVEQAAKDIQSIQSAFDYNDFEAVGRIAHRMKGAAANSSIESIRLPAAEVESLVRNGESVQAQEHLEALMSAWREFQIALTSGQPTESEELHAER